MAVPRLTQGVRSAWRHRSGAGFLFAYRHRMAKELYRIGISGSYGGLNLGDEAILQSIITQLRRDLPVRDHGVLARSPRTPKRRHGVERAVPVRKLSRAEVLPEVERLDLLILGGGGILYDAEARIYLREVAAREGEAACR